MNPNSILSLILLFIIALVLSIYSEFILNIVWNKAYFTKGLPILVLHRSVKIHHNNVPSEAVLNVQFKNQWSTKIVFRQLDTNKYAFRETYWRKTFYLPAMHGLILFNCKNDRIDVTGYANWYFIVFFIVGLIMVMSQSSISKVLIAFAIFLFIEGFFYVSQLFLFVKITLFAEKVWARQYLSEPLPP